MLGMCPLETQPPKSSVGINLAAQPTSHSPWLRPLNGRIPVVGIVGGIASGKSTVASCFGRLGAACINADQLGHRVLQEPAVRAAISARWGSAVFETVPGSEQPGDVNRRELARLVFAPTPQGAEDLAALEAITHPRIRALLTEQLAALQSARSHPLIVLDAALLFEAGWAEVCDHIIFVEVPREQRWERAARRGWTAAQFADRERTQLDLDEKRRRSNSVLPNQGAPEETCANVLRWWQGIANLPGTPSSGSVKGGWGGVADSGGADQASRGP